MADLIHIENLRIRAHIGVTAEERAAPQRLAVFVTIEPNVGFIALDDSIEKTIDYALVCNEIQAIAAGRPRHLVETLAQEIADQLLAHYPIWRIVVELRKFALPDADYAAIRIERPAS